MSRHPITKWAQRSDKVFLTIELPDANDVKLSLKPEGHFNFSAKGADDLPYELDLELFDAVNVEESKAAVAPRTICYLIKKAESKWWPRLMKEEGKPPVFLKVDWDKWQDEDDEDVGFNDIGDMDFSKLGMGGADDDDIEDDDEDDVVESANKDEEGSKAEESKGEEAPAAAAEEGKP
ncbi:co-chaperone protein p23-1-like [Phragmites australis]|uniref:co-chaperone protein p23-1-like n=1 Tax=Phragmites australis TaxID=29695 RepID=UPI002D79499A|nr:co-chaperone protein p23-1-like [Phragmites australis]